MKFSRTQADRKFTVKDAIVRKVIAVRNIVNVSKWERNARIYANARIAKMGLHLLRWKVLLHSPSQYFLLTAILILYLTEGMVNSLSATTHSRNMSLMNNGIAIIIINRMEHCQIKK